MVLDSVMEATRGNPLFVLQLIEVMFRRNLLSQDGERLSLTSPAQPLHLPATAPASVTERLKVLDAATLSVLQTAAVFGEHFTADDLAPFHEPPGLEDAIDTAVSAIKTGAYDFIEKPFKADRLLLVVDRAIEADKLKRENLALRRLFFS